MPSSAELRNNAEFEQWLEEHGCSFEDAFVVGLWPDPTTTSACDTIRVVLGEQVGGTYVAGEERTIQDFVLTASGVRRSTLGRDLVFAPGHCCQGIELIPADEGLAFRIDAPGSLEIACEALFIEVLPRRVERVQPWTSDSEFGATLPGRSLPSPENWLTWFRAEGVEVCWRIWCGDAQKSPPDPKDYEGWFLQIPSRIQHTKGGLFFFSCRERENALVVHWQYSDPAGDRDAAELWAAARRVMARLEAGEVWCGNCRFSASEWRRFVADGSLPPKSGST